MGLLPELLSRKPENLPAVLARHRPPSSMMALVASSRKVDMANKSEGQRLNSRRQGWQQDALNMADVIPELSFAFRLRQNAASRIRYFPAVENTQHPDSDPIPFDEAEGLPQDIIDICNQALFDLGGRAAIRNIQTSHAWNFDVTGEAYFMGREGENGRIEWSVRSVDEILFVDNKWMFRETPSDPQGAQNFEPLDMNETYLARMWVPHPRFQAYATSPMKALIDICEELLLLSRDVRAIARSRLAGAGIMKIPSGLSVESMDEDDEDPKANSFLAKLTTAMMTPIAEEGVASAVVPMVVSGEEHDLAALDHLVLDRPYSALALELRAECISRIATGLDLPREALEGIADMNHWSAWAVSDEMFRHHLEPAEITRCDALTGAYLKPYLESEGVPAEWVERICIWYDPTDLITKPDPMANATQMHDRFVISDKAYREAGGATEDDAPEISEIYRRLIAHMKTFPPNVLEAILHQNDPNLVIPPIEGSGQVPGMGPKGAIEPPPPPIKGPSIDTIGAPGGGDTQAPSEPSSPASPTPGMTGRSQALAQRSDELDKMSRKLSEIDSRLKLQIRTAANAAMVETLKRAGAKIRTKAGSRTVSQEAKDAITASADVPNWLLPATLGSEIVHDMGFTAAAPLLSADWSALKTQFHKWVAAGQKQALDVIKQIVGDAVPAEAFDDAERSFDHNTTMAWTQFEDDLDEASTDALTDASIDPDTVCPMGIVRGALNIAGGASNLLGFLKGRSNSEGEGQASLQTQIGSGGVVSALLEQGGLVPVSFDWVHGPSEHPFEPHEDLDGEQFASFNDDVLANPGDFPANAYFFPGDHTGCSCDFTTNWGRATSSEQAEEAEETEDEMSGGQGGEE